MDSDGRRSSAEELPGGRAQAAHRLDGQGDHGGPLGGPEWTSRERLLMLTSARSGPRRVVSSQTVVLAVLVVAGLALRWSLFGVVSGDYRNDLAPWYAHLASSGGFAGLADNFGNYNTPYLDLLAALTYLPFDPLVGIKLISVFFDLVLTFFAYRIVRAVRAESAWLPTILAGGVLFLPTV